ncbi:MAG: hypothetical protein JSS97_16005 [Actinobacteria bacterium]|nr:hypothetical protein [Actinomycetota bacterium]
MNEKATPRRRSWFVTGIAMAVALVIGGALGRLSAGSPRTGSESPSTTLVSTKTEAEVPVGYPDTPRGAAAAVAAYQRAFASPSILRGGVMRDRIEAVAMPDYVEAMLEANTPGRERIAAGPIGEGIATGLQTLYAAVPIGYEIEAFSKRRARVLTWGFTLLGNASAVEPSAYFGLTHTDLVWSGDRWRIAQTEGGFGPTPKLGTSPGSLGAYDVIGVTEHLRSYELAP